MAEIHKRKASEMEVDFRARPRGSWVKRSSKRSRGTKGIERIHSFKRTFCAYVSAIGQNVAGLDLFPTWAFKLNDLPNYQEFTNLFDEYRIDRVDLKFVFGANAMQLQTVPANTVAGLVPIVTAIDYDDANPCTAMSQLFEYESAKIHRMGDIFTVSLRPKISTAAYGGGVFTSYTNQRGIWIDNASPSVAHFGVKACIQTSLYGAGANTNQTLEVFATYHIKCRDVC